MGRQEADTKATRRVKWLALFALLWAVLIAGKLIYLQVFRHQYYRQLSDRQTSMRVEIRAPRGAIFDRLGHPLAMSVPVDSIVVNPMRAPDPAVAAGLLAPILGLDRPALETKLASAARQRRGFLWVKRKVSFSEARTAAETAAGLDRVPGREPEGLPEGIAGLAPGRQRGPPGERQRRSRTEPGCGTPRQAGVGADGGRRGPPGGGFAGSTPSRSPARTSP